MFLEKFESNLERYSEVLNVPDERQKNVFFEYVHFVKACYGLDKISNILEIGSGHSTPLFSMIAKDYNADFYSIDLDFSRVQKAIKDTEFEVVVDKYCHHVKSLTVSGSEFGSFYNKDYISSLMGTDLASFEKFFDQFIVMAGDDRKIKKMAEHFGFKPEINELKKFMLTDKGLMNDRVVRDIYSFDESFDTETAFIIDHENPYHEVYNDKIQSIDSWDVIFFDSGEFSNNIEFEKLAPKIRKGGLAVFHDITFPKSYKNFIPCSYILSEKDKWEVLYVDTQKTPQGLMVAKKLY